MQLAQWPDFYRSFFLIVRAIQNGISGHFPVFFPWRADLIGSCPAVFSTDKASVLADQRQI